MLVNSFILDTPSETGQAQLALPGKLNPKGEKTPK